MEMRGIMNVQRIAGALIVMMLLTSCAGMSERQKAFWQGAAVGAAAGTWGGSAVGSRDDNDEQEEGAILGFLVGGLIGGVIGALNADTETPPPPQEAVVPEVEPPIQEPAPAPEPPVAEVAPAPEPEPVRPAPVVEAPPVVKERIVLRGINFDFDKSVIKPEYEPVLDHAASILQDRRDVDVVIEGHTCSIGTEEYNQGLSERRARSVYQYLLDKGLAPERLDTVGYGETRPIADNSTQQGRRLNRRVEFDVKD